MVIVVSPAPTHSAATAARPSVPAAANLAFGGRPTVAVAAAAANSVCRAREEEAADAADGGSDIAGRDIAADADGGAAAEAVPAKEPTSTGGSAVPPAVSLL